LPKLVIYATIIIAVINVADTAIFVADIDIVIVVNVVIAIIVAAISSAFYIFLPIFLKKPSNLTHFSVILSSKSNEFHQNKGNLSGLIRQDFKF